MPASSYRVRRIEDMRRLLRDLCTLMTLGQPGVVVLAGCTACCRPCVLSYTFCKIFFKAYFTVMRDKTEIKQFRMCVCLTYR
jgi:hypothetical protein